MKKQDTPAVTAPVGLYIHLLNDDNTKIEKQGQIIAMDGDYLLIQFFSWVMGEETYIEAYAKENVYWKGRMYLTAEDMRDAWERRPK